MSIVSEKTSQMLAIRAELDSLGARYKSGQENHAPLKKRISVLSRKYATLKNEVAILKLS